MASTRLTYVISALIAFACAGAPAATAQPEPDGSHTDADVRFFQGMIHHHAQAVEMTSLVETRTARRDMRMLAQRIAVSQADEIAWMTRWLADRVPAAGPDHGHHGHHDAGHQELMPGMLTPEGMAEMAGADGAEFDRLFLEGMIRHHEGALTMVEHLFASPGAAQATEVYQIATDIDADQRADISRMREMLEALPPSR
jgi:uncharacterized protein (DUF305 family)